ncbi:MAG: DNA polymerase Y family protein [Planctomycetota bacterium]
MTARPDMQWPNVVAVQVMDFPVAVCRAVTPRLRERPVVIVSSMRPMGRVLSLSAEARSAGLYVGMRYPVALGYLPDAAYLLPDDDLQRRAELAMLKLAVQFSPRLVRCGAGRIALDVTGTGRLLGHPLDVASRLQRQLGETYRLPGAVGLSCRRIFSTLAARLIAPSGIMEVLPGREAQFLEMVPPEWVPGVGGRTLELLRDMNITRLSMLGQFTESDLVEVFGPPGRHLAEAVAVGRRDPMLPWAADPAELLPMDDRGIEVDLPLLEETADPVRVRAALGRAVGRCGSRLRLQGLEARRLHLSVLYSDGRSSTGSRRLHEPTGLESTLLDAARTVLERTWTRRVRLARLTVRLSELCDASRQIDLFDEVDRRRQQRRLHAIDLVRRHFGDDAIDRGSDLPGRADAG